MSIVYTTLTHTASLLTTYGDGSKSYLLVSEERDAGGSNDIRFLNFSYPDILLNMIDDAQNGFKLNSHFVEFSHYHLEWNQENLNETIFIDFRFVNETNQYKLLGNGINIGSFNEILIVNTSLRLEHIVFSSIYTKSTRLVARKTEMTGHDTILVLFFLRKIVTKL